MNFVSEIFSSVLNFIYSIVGNYGWSVVIFTFLIRILFLPLDVKSKKSMRAMSKLQPKLKELEAKYGKDKEKYNMKTQELYKKEKINPLAGCLPLLIQLPIFWCMYTAMQTAGNEQMLKLIVDWATAVQNNVNFEPVFESWLWIKNVFQPDSFSSTILPAFGSTLSNIKAVSGSLVLTEENIEIARTFLSSEAYRDIAIAWGAGNFLNIPLNFLIVQFTLRIPTTIQALFSSANGLFILPVASALSQFLSTKLMTPATDSKQVVTAEQSQTMQNNPMNSGMMKWFFPLFSLWICATSNAAFALYWMSVNVLTIVQTVVVGKYLDYKDQQEAPTAPEE